MAGTRTARPAPASASTNGAELRPPRSRRRRLRRAGGWSLVLVALAAIGVGVWYLVDRNGGVEASGDPTPTETGLARVERRDLAETESLDGTLGYADAETLVNRYAPVDATGAQAAGTLTAIADEGSVVEPGQELYRVDGTPVVLLQGAVPAYRALSRTEESTGDVDPVAAQLTGTITRLPSSGDVVEPGGALYEVDGRPVVLLRGSVAAYRAIGAGTTERPVTGQLAGTVTAIVERGATVEPGSVLYRVDGRPVVLLDGSVAMYRQLSEGVDDGRDVKQLERNLVALGYDPDGEIEVDGEFDAATTDAVERWQEDLGVTEDGVVDSGDVVFQPGQRRLVSTVTATVGSSAQPGLEVLRTRSTGTSGADVRQLERALVELGFDPNGRIDVDGVFDDATEAAVRRWQRSTGQKQDGVVDLGEVVFLPGEREVAGVTASVGASVQPGVEVLRLQAVSPTTGDDVRQLEQGLVELGLDPDGTVAVDGVFDEATEAMVERWQASLGAEQDGVVDLGEVVFAAGPVRVGAHQVDVGAVVQSGTAITTLTSTGQVVTVELAADRQSLVAVGDAVTVELPDGTEAPATVEEMGKVANAVATADGSTSDPTITVTIALDAAGATQYDEAPVDVAVTTEQATGVLAVPASALIALASGGYAVEVALEGGTTQLVRVDPGVFAEGWVEVESDGLEDGAQVVVPA